MSPRLLKAHAEYARSVPLRRMRCSRSDGYSYTNALGASPTCGARRVAAAAVVVVVVVVVVCMGLWQGAGRATLEPRRRQRVVTTVGLLVGSG